MNHRCDPAQGDLISLNVRRLTPSQRVINLRFVNSVIDVGHLLSLPVWDFGRDGASTVTSSRECPICPGTGKIICYSSSPLLFFMFRSSLSCSIDFFISNRGGLALANPCRRRDYILILHCDVHHGIEITPGTLGKTQNGGR